MPRLRRATSSAEFPTTQTESAQLQPVETNPRSVQDPDTFFRAIVELERVRGLWVHAETLTLH
jgi:hypothetical protein